MSRLSPRSPRPGEEGREEEQKEELQAESTHPMLPFYPGTKGETQLDGARVTLRLTTTDSLEQVCVYYEDFYRSQGLEPSGRSDFESQVSQTFTGPSGTAMLNVRKGRPTSINLSYEGAGGPIFSC